MSTKQAKQAERDASRPFTPTDQPKEWTLPSDSLLRDRDSKRREYVADVVAANALRSMGESDAAANAVAAVVIAAADSGTPFRIDAALLAAARERAGRERDAAKAVERAAATERDAAGYEVPRESRRDTLVRLIRQRYGPRIANAAGRGYDLAPTANEAGESLTGHPYRAAIAVSIASQVSKVAGKVTTDQVTATAAALLADIPTFKRDHDAATCTYRDCPRCTAAKSATFRALARKHDTSECKDSECALCKYLSGRGRPNVAPVRSIGSAGPLTVEGPKVKRGTKYRPTAKQPKERTTPRAIHLLRESSLYSLTDLASHHSASGTTHESEVPTADHSPLVAASLLSLVAVAGGNHAGERADIHQYVNSLTATADSEKMAADVEVNAAFQQSEVSRWAAYWSGLQASHPLDRITTRPRLASSSERDAARHDSKQAAAAAAAHSRRARQHQAAAEQAERTYRDSEGHRVKSRSLLSAAVAVAAASHAPADDSERVKRQRAIASDSTLAAAVAAVAAADDTYRPASVRSRWAVWCRHDDSLRLAAEQSRSRWHEAAEQVKRHRERVTAATLAADAAAASDAWGVAATFTRVGHGSRVAADCWQAEAVTRAAEAEAGTGSLLLALVRWHHAATQATLSEPSGAAATAAASSGTLTALLAAERAAGRLAAAEQAERDAYATAERDGWQYVKHHASLAVPKQQPSE